ncbi:HAMP domain-containing sensor histidine kinase [Octadecabacter sp. 1_MG-2023]|uniref:sensor histidine kinase n=1 Tax=unclassified Octadecabacter TaxID=196158 RepID=UPI001C09B38B|nr:MULTISPECIES: HAMP domain-containing sensor histidine kinase [unclassified Octadecabacter]MBU2994380.1 HAMP domain-containing histidine kinase [Octadecabacter sp. B2R22]MDO6734329.1 HAMP domain-containing sensor histidine kinase [Octadecabacter sp. 1_MG-2023]
MRIRRKWRPPLWMVVGITLAVVLCLPIIGIFFVRYMWPVLGYREAVYVAGIGVLAATFVVGWGLWRILLRPVQAMRTRVTALRASDDAALGPLDHYGTADMQALGQSFLDMGRALRSRETVLRSYADHVTHELKSPLTVVRGAAELLAMPDLPDAERARLLGRIEASADRMTALLDAQRSLAQAQEPAARGAVLLSDVANGIEVLEDGKVPLSKDALQLVLDHLVGNAKAHGATKITASFDGNLTVQDNGSGVSLGNQDRIFEPFFTTRRETGGTGMGLSIVRRILEAHEAEITLAPSDQGARFVITF